MLSQKELELRDELIKDGIAECKELIGKQSSEAKYFFYEGCLEGLEECKKLDDLDAYTKRIQELSRAQDREKMEEDEIMFRIGHLDYEGCEIDSERVQRLHGIRTEIEFVYKELKEYKQRLNLEAKF